MKALLQRGLMIALIALLLFGALRSRAAEIRSSHDAGSDAELMVNAITLAYSGVVGLRTQD